MYAPSGESVVEADQRLRDTELADSLGVAAVLVVPVGVGSLAAAAARHGAATGVRVVGVEPATAACLDRAAASRAATSELATYGLTIGGSGAAPLAGLRLLVADAAFGPSSRVLLVATEGRTGRIGA